MSPLFKRFPSCANFLHILSSGLKVYLVGQELKDKAYLVRSAQSTRTWLEGFRVLIVGMDSYTHLLQLRVLCV